MTLRTNFIICISRYVKRVLFEKLYDNAEINKEDLQLTEKKLAEASNYAFLRIRANI